MEDPKLYENKHIEDKVAEEIRKTGDANVVETDTVETISHIPSLGEKIKRYGHHPVVTSRHINILSKAGHYDIDTLTMIVESCNTAIDSFKDGEELPKESRELRDTSINVLIDLIETAEQTIMASKDLDKDLLFIKTERFNEAFNNYKHKNRRTIPVEEADKYTLSAYLILLTLKRFSEPNPKRSILSMRFLKKALKNLNTSIVGHRTGYIRQQEDKFIFRVMTSFGVIFKKLLKINTGVGTEELKESHLLSKLYTRTNKYFDADNVKKGYQDLIELEKLLNRIDDEDPKYRDVLNEAFGNFLRQTHQTTVRNQMAVAKVEKELKEHKIPSDFFPVEYTGDFHSYSVTIALTNVIVQYVNTKKKSIGRVDTKFILTLFENLVPYMVYETIADFMTTELVGYVKEKGYSAGFIGILENFLVTEIASQFEFMLSFNGDTNSSKELYDFFSAYPNFDVSSFNSDALKGTDLDKSWEDITLAFSEFLSNQVSLVTESLRLKKFHNDLTRVTAKKIMKGKIK